MPHSIKSAVMGHRVQPQSPWILYFDGVTRDIPSNHGGIGAVLKDSRGHTVVELKKFVGLGVSSCVAKYKALIAGLKKARSLGVEYLLVKGDSRLVHNQVKPGSNPCLNVNASTCHVIRLTNCRRQT